MRGSVRPNQAWTAEDNETVSHHTAHILEIALFPVAVLVIMGVMILLGRLFATRAAQERRAERQRMKERRTEASVSGEATSGVVPADETPQTPQLEERGPAANPGESAPDTEGLGASTPDGEGAGSAPAERNGDHRVSDREAPLVTPPATATNGNHAAVEYLPTAGWRPDPGGRPGMLRYFDGRRWTDHYALRIATATPASH